MREAAVSPERFNNKKDQLRFTPNGTKVPEGPPPQGQDDVPLPPVPPFPSGDVVGDPQQSSFVSGFNDMLDIYDTCESKPK